jgi:hypothetical protein
MRPAGHWWDAIRVPRHIGELVLLALGDHSGAVIEDPGGPNALLYWLIEPGAAAGWTFPATAGVQVHGPTSHVVVPGPQRTAGPHWRVPPTPSRCLTQPEQLRQALHAAIDAALGPRAEEAR